MRSLLCLAGTLGIGPRMVSCPLFSLEWVMLLPSIGHYAKAMEIVRWKYS